MDCRAQLASLAIEELDKGDFLMATKILTTGIRLEPNNHELYLERSVCHHKLGDFQASLDDVNTAIRLKPTDHNAHYQKGLALLGFDMLSEARISFKKAIEMRAKQEDSKLRDIFNLLAQSTKEMGLARDRLLSHLALQGRPVVPIPTNLAEDISPTQVQGTAGSEPVDSTTDRPVSMEPGTSSVHQDMPSLESHLINNNNDSNNLVVNKRNMMQPMPNQAQALEGTMILSNNNGNHINNNSNKNSNHNNNRVSSSASHINNFSLPPMNVSPDISGIGEVEASTLAADLMASNEHVDQSKAEQFAWNIRRSERIFLHNTNESPGPSGLHIGIMTRGNEPIMQAQQSRQGSTNSTPTSNICAGNVVSTKRSHDISPTYQLIKPVQLKDGTNSHTGSDVDVDDSCTASATNTAGASSVVSDTLNSNRKRVMITPSSSMPTSATNLVPSTSTSSKDDSYSSKYKRLRRDRERARRGTSKLCTIKLSDLEELHKNAHSDLGKRTMRVIAPIDGWLYSGQLRVDDVKNTKNASAQQYVVKLDGDATGSSYLFSQGTVLNDVIKEVRVNSVSELRKGARICCYWSRQYKCLSTGVVTSRTFEATKSLVSVKYDNGDLSALPLEDLRLLPPDYPKYMSNCDPLLLAKNGDNGPHMVVSEAVPASNEHAVGNQIGLHRALVDHKPTTSDLQTSGNSSPPGSNMPSNGINHSINSAEKSQITIENGAKIEVEVDNQVSQNQEGVVEVEREEFLREDDIEENTRYEIEVEKDDVNRVYDEVDEDDEDEDATIPPTDETIDFITGETLPELDNESNKQLKSSKRMDMIQITKDSMTLTNDIRLGMKKSQDSSEENTYNMAYCPWLFEGPPRKSKRHGRTYRDNYSSIRRGNEVIRVGDSAELMPRDESILPFIAKIDGLWATGRGEMRVRVRWYYRLVETEGEPYELQDGENALFETDHLDENDVQSIYRSTKILTWSEYSKDHLGHVNKNNDNSSKIFYLAGYYDPVRRIKHLRSDVKEAL